MICYNYIPPCVKNLLPDGFRQRDGESTGIPITSATIPNDAFTFEPTTITSATQDKISMYTIKCE